jgi:hypothetical protein
MNLYLLCILLGAGIVGAVWAILYNQRTHPGKVEAQLGKALDEAKALEQKASDKLRGK